MPVHRMYCIASGNQMKFNDAMNYSFSTFKEEILGKFSCHFMVSSAFSSLLPNAFFNFQTSTAQ